MRRVAVHIDRLVLKGFRYEERHLIAAALQEELARLWALPEAAEELAALGDVPHLRVNSVKLGGDPKPFQVGTETARAIRRNLGQRTSAAPVRHSDGPQAVKEDRSE
jgi:hypothetical protein